MLTRDQMIENHNYWSDHRTIQGMISHESYLKKGNTTEIDIDWVFQKWMNLIEDGELEGEWLEFKCICEEGKKEHAAEVVFLHWLGKTFNIDKYKQLDQIQEEWEYDKRIDFPVCKIATKYVVCPTCNGRGSHVTPSIDCGGISMQDFDRDPEFHENYMRGTYNQTCNECHGERLVLVRTGAPDGSLHEWCNEKLQEHYEFEYEYAREVAAERRMGC